MSEPAPTTTTPLLQNHARPIATSPRAPRPRARTTPDLPQASSSLLSHASSHAEDDLEGGGSSLDQIEEKRSAGLAEWRRRYGGKQRECVVCLEEYVDGVSRVMELPCGHEFHEGCM
jgi:hypothetical protein